MSRTRKLRAGAVTAVAALAVVGAAGAQSPPDRVRLAGERTTLTPSAELGRALSAGGITVTPVGRATGGEGGSVIFPIVRGRVDPQSLRGRIVHRGGVRITRGERSLRLRRLLIRTTKRGSVLRATVGRGACGGPERRGARRRATGGRRLGAVPRRSRRGCGRMAVARLSNVQRSDSGGLLVATADLTLTRAAARRINRRLGTQVVNGGTRLGTAKIEAKPRS
ncbi:MAG: hypothetical protein M3131_09870 [Actinomycetota bacterium]|nr:hypothetical protein [Actinomycetota bacterium]